jgi:hypothetical protein
LKKEGNTNWPNFLYFGSPIFSLKYKKDALNFIYFSYLSNLAKIFLLIITTLATSQNWWKKNHCFITSHTKLAYKRIGVFLSREKWKKKLEGTPYWMKRGKGQKQNYVDWVTPPLAPHAYRVILFLNYSWILILPQLTYKLVICSQF